VGATNGHEEIDVGKVLCSEAGCVNLAYMGGYCREHVVLIKKYRIEGTDIWMFSAWEPSKLIGAHHTITYVDGEVFGRIGTLHFTEEEFEKAYALIIDEHPEAAEGKGDQGEA
jgi:hypothetical protein